MSLRLCLPSFVLGAILLSPSEWLRGLPIVRAEVAPEDGGSCVISAARADYTAGANLRRLRNDLLCDYDRLVVQPGTEVEINLFIYRLDLDVHRGFLQMLVDLGWRWYDARLRWDPTQYSNEKELFFTEKEIWIPDLEALNSLTRDFKLLRCLVESTGNVSCYPVFNMHTTCGSSVRYWPVDEHNCVFEIASRNHDNREYTIVLPQNYTELMLHWDLSHEWSVVNATQVLRDSVINANFHFTRLEARLTLRRNKFVHILTIGVPTLVLPCLVLAQLWVDPRWPGRLLLGCTTIAALCLYLVYLSDTVPDDTQGQAPLIVLFYRDSLVMATLVVLLTVALRGLADRPGHPPPWLAGGSSWLLRAAPRPVAGMLLEDDDEEEDEGGVPAERPAELTDQADKAANAPVITWKKIVRIVDRVVFLALTLTFLVMLFTASV